MSLFKKAKVADFFLSEAHPYSKKRALKPWHIFLVLGVITTIVLGVGTYLDQKAQREREIAQAKRDAERAAHQDAASQATGSHDSSYADLKTISRPGVAPPARERSASQIIKRSSASGDVLPMGTMAQVNLIGQVESMDGSHPVTAYFVDDVLSPAQAVVIPKGTKVIGSGQLDSNRERLQVHFHTLVFPEGEQFGVSAIATMPDGSSGLTGKFSSGLLRRHASQFIGNFIGGLAEGMKDRTAGGQMGIPFEPGSLKNGALNGVAQSSLAYAKSSSEQMGQGSASIQIPSGKAFVLYFEKEFHQ